MPEWLKVAIGVLALIAAPTIPALYVKYLWVVSRNYDRPDAATESHASQHDQGDSVPSSAPVDPSTTKSTPIRGNTENQSGDSDMKPTDWLLVLVGFLQFGAIVGQICIYRTQARIMRRSLDATRRAANAARDSADISRRILIASHRAWIHVTVNIVNQPAWFDKSGAGLTVSFVIKNLGTVPAINITEHAWLVLLSEGDGAFSVQIQQRKCDEVRRQPFHPFGFTLFPDETSPESSGIEGFHALSVACVSG